MIFLDIDENLDIRKLALRVWNGFAYDAHPLKYATKRLQSLQSLQLWHSSNTEYFRKDNSTIVFPSVEKFTIVNESQKSEKFARNLASLAFPKLKKFHLIGDSDAAGCITFLAQHPNIQRIKFEPKKSHPKFQSEKIWKKLTKLCQS